MSKMTTYVGVHTIGHWHRYHDDDDDDYDVDVVVNELIALAL